MSMQRVVGAGALVALAAFNANACGGEIESAGSGALSAEGSSSSSGWGGTSGSSSGSYPPYTGRGAGVGSPAAQGYPAAPPDAGSAPYDAGPPPAPAPLATCPSSVVPPPFVADVSLSDLAVAKSSIVGHWCGTQTNPWNGCHEVDLKFDSDGHYSARSLDASFGPAFYWGTDDDTPLKQWRLEDVLANGTVTGEIDVAFFYGGSLYGLPAWQGLIDDLAFDAARDRLRFEMRRDDGYGPLVFDLARCP